MKKLGLFLIFICLFSYSKVKAEKFIFNDDLETRFKLTWKNGVTDSSRYLTMYKITNKDNKVYYNVQPEITLFSVKNYTKQDITMAENIYKRIALIMHYGYGYQNHNTDAYYFATQYLIFQTLNVTEVSIVDTENNKSDYASKEIKEIEELINANTYTFSSYKTNNDYIILDDPYITENFDIEIDDIKISMENGFYKLKFLKEQEEYQIHLKSKNKCIPKDTWASSGSSNLMGYSGLCEEDAILTIKRELEKQDPSKEEQKKEEIDEQVNKIKNVNTKKDSTPSSEPLEVNMPSTAKYSFNWLIYLLMCGNIYYVYKK